MTFSEKEFEDIRIYFQDIDFSKEKNRIFGELSFSAFYDGEKLYLNPEKGQAHKYFNGYYEIEIHLSTSDIYGLPKVYETGGKILNFANENNIEIKDMHLNGDKSCCLGVFTPNELNEMTLYKYITGPVFSFFAWQAYRMTFMEKPPWGEHPHCNWQLIQNKKILMEMFKCGRNDRCPCGSGRKFKNCCLDKFETFKKGIQNV